MSKLLPVHPGQQVALVDDADYARVSPYRWCLSSQGYAVARIAGRLHHLQRFLLAPASRAKIIDRNGDKLDNRRENLVVVTHAQAMQRQKERAGTSRDKGGQLHRQTGLWRATITPGDRMVHLGYFEDEAEAAQAYDQAALHYYGATAWTNFTHAGKVNPELALKRRARSSQYRGVHLAKNSGRWRATVCLVGRKLHLGCFDTEEEAARAYDRGAIQFHGPERYGKDSRQTGHDDSTPFRGMLYGQEGQACSFLLRVRGRLLLP